MRIRRFFVTAASLALLPLGALPGEATVTAQCDFDNDGFDDVPIGSSGEDIGALFDAGAVGVVYGSIDSDGARSSFYTQNSSGIKGVAEDIDYFGWSVACGQFDSDSFADLAIGATFDLDAADVYSGTVTVVHGSSSGLGADDQLWSLASSGVIGSGQHEDWFGTALASGDFDGDGFDDLAIGVRAEEAGSVNDAGAVNVLYGTASGLTATDDQQFTQATTGIQGTPATNEGWGQTLAVGDFDSDGYDDLAVAASWLDGTDSTDNAGEVNVLFGSATGLTTRDQLWRQSSTGISGTPEPNDLFGESLAAGDVDGDGFDDLAIGVPFENDMGQVHLLFGSLGGLTATGSTVIRQGTDGVLGAQSSGDWFGFRIAIGDADGDGYSDLAVGAPFDGESGVALSGSVNLIRGSISGLTGTSDELWHEDSSGIQGQAETDDAFGLGVAFADLNGNNRFDLLIGSPWEDVGTRVDAGVFHVLPGSTSGVTATGDQYFDQTVVQAVEQDDFFGQMGAGT